MEYLFYSTIVVHCWTKLNITGIIIDINPIGMVDKNVP